MSRPPKSVTAEDFPLLYPRLVRLMADPDRASRAINGSVKSAATAFNAIGQSPELLDAWLVKWLTPSAKQRMWASLRQMVYKQKQKMRAIMISEDAYLALNNIAKRHKVTLSDAVLYLTQKRNKSG